MIPGSKHIVRKIAHGDLFTSSDVSDTEELLETEVRVVVVVAVGAAGVVGPTHPGVEAGLHGADGHGVGLEDGQDLVGVVRVVVGQTHHQLSIF